MLLLSLLDLPPIMLGVILCFTILVVKGTMPLFRKKKRLCGSAIIVLWILFVMGTCGNEPGSEEARKAKALQVWEDAKDVG